MQWQRMKDEPLFPLRMDALLQKFVPKNSIGDIEATSGSRNGLSPVWCRPSLKPAMVQYGLTLP